MIEKTRQGDRKQDKYRFFSYFYRLGLHKKKKSNNYSSLAQKKKEYIMNRLIEE